MNDDEDLAMSLKTEEKINLMYRDHIEEIITNWFAVDLATLDQQMTACYTDTDGSTGNFDVLMARKTGTLRHIQIIINKTVLAFARLVDRLESDGPVCLMDQFFQEQIDAYLTRVGIRSHYLEGACLDQ